MSGARERDDIARHAAAVARELWGEPNKGLSSKEELRFGKQGSMSVDVATGQFFDHEAKEGGGVLWAIERETGKAVEGGHAIQWLRDNGFHVEDREPPAASGRARSGDNWMPPGIPDHAKLTATYDYADAHGELRYQVVRYDWDDPENPKGHSKDFRQRQPDKSKSHGWNWKVKGLTPLPYRLPELIEAVAQGYTVFVVEGEKKVDRLRELGVPATCNSGGAGKFPDALLEYFVGAHVVVIPDNDPQAKHKDGTLRFHDDGRPVLPGQDHAKAVAHKLLDVAASTKLLELPGLGPKGDVVDWLDAGGTIDQLYDLAEQAQAADASAVPYVSRFDAVSWSDLDAPGPEHEWLIKGVLTRGELSMNAGASQSGKTFIVLDQALAIARGVDWMGRKTVRGGVVYCAPEGARGLRRKRLKAYRQYFDVAGDPLPFTLLQSPLDLYGGDDVTDALIEEIKHWARTYDCPLELVVIDTFSKATPGMNENDGAEVGRVLERCDRIRRATGAHVMLVHHLNADGTKARGHTSIFANLENVMTVRKVEAHHDSEGRQLRELVISKQKEGEDGRSFRFVLQSVQIGIDRDGDPETSCVVVRPSGEATDGTKPDGIVLGGANNVALRALYDVLQKDGVLAPPEMGLPFGTLVVSRRAHGARYAQVAGTDEPEALSDEEREKLGDALRQSLKRARDTLFSKEIIGMDDQWIWATGKRPVAGFPPPPGSPRQPRRTREKDESPPEPADLPFAREDLEGL